jgi:hypothetical protein
MNVDKQIDEVARLNRERIQQRLLDVMARNRQPLSTDDLAETVDLPFQSVQRAVCDLVATGRLALAGRTPYGRPLYRPVEIGLCEWCGLVDHHLIAGECPRCANRSTTIGVARPDEEQLELQLPTEGAML